MKVSFAKESRTTFTRFLPSRSRFSPISFFPITQNNNNKHSFSTGNKTHFSARVHFITALNWSKRSQNDFLSI